MSQHSVVVLGGGLSGLAAADTLARESGFEVTVLEAGPFLGGLAGSFREAGCDYPIGYHHVLARDRALRFFLDEAGLAAQLAWGRAAMLVEHAGELLDLSCPTQFLRVPLRARDRLRFALLMLGAGRLRLPRGGDPGAAALLDRLCGTSVREQLFEPLTQLKFGRSCGELSARWLVERLRYRESTEALGYLPGVNWTTPLCAHLVAQCSERGCRLEKGTPVVELESDGGRVLAAITAGGERHEAEFFVSSLPPPVYLELLPDQTPSLQSIEYTGLLSLLAGCDSSPVDAYWINLSSRQHAACAVFDLNALNPTLGGGGHCLNYVTHVSDRTHPLWQKSDAEIVEAYREDHQRLFGCELSPRWTRLMRVPYYSPMFSRHYRNPPDRSESFENVFFTGTYCTHPSVASTGTALGSGVRTAVTLIRTLGLASDRMEQIRAHRP